MVIVNTECFLFRKLYVDFRHFRVFIFCHRAHSKTRKPRKIFYMLIFRGIKTIYLIWSTLKDTTLQVLLKVIKENLRLNLEAAFLLLKPKLFLDNKVIALYQFSSSGERLTLGLLPKNIFKNAESTENFILSAFWREIFPKHNLLMFL